MYFFSATVGTVNEIDICKCRICWNMFKILEHVPSAFLCIVHKLLNWIKSSHLSHPPPPPPVRLLHRQCVEQLPEGARVSPAPHPLPRRRWRHFPLLESPLPFPPSPPSMSAIRSSVKVLEGLMLRSEEGIDEGKVSQAEVSLGRRSAKWDSSCFLWAEEGTDIVLYGSRLLDSLSRKLVCRGIEEERERDWMLGWLQKFGRRYFRGRPIAEWCPSSYSQCVFGLSHSRKDKEKNERMLLRGKSRHCWKRTLAKKALNFTDFLV